MDILKSDYDKFRSAIEWKLKNSKLKSWITADDIAHDIYIAHQHASLDEWVAFIPEFIGKAQTREGIANLSEEKREHKKQFSKHWIAKEKATNPDYITICRKRNNWWEKMQRKNRTAWSYMRNAAKRTQTYLWNLIRKSPKPQPCPLHKGMCLRVSISLRYKKIYSCPLAHKFTLEGGKCYPKKKK